jgi:hypothetical protein
LDTNDSPWEGKAPYTKVANVMQAPIRLLLQLINPVVYHGDHGYAWDRNLHVLLLLLAPPWVVVVFDEEAFYAVQDASAPSVAVAACVGFVLAMVCLMTSSVDKPPPYNAAFAGLGFVVSMSVIYALADEIIGVLSAFGVILNISTVLDLCLGFLYQPVDFRARQKHSGKLTSAPLPRTSLVLF